MRACAVISEHWAVLPESQDMYPALPSSGLASSQKLESPAPSKPDTEALEQLLTQQRAGDAPPRPQSLASFCLWEKRLLSPN